MKPYFKTLQEEIDEQKIINRKKIALLNYVQSKIPKKLSNVVAYSVSDMGVSTIRCFLYFDKKSEITPDIMQELFSFGKELKNRKWVFTKFFREELGTFSYMIKKDYKYPGTDYLIFFEDAPNVDGCKIVKKTIKMEVYTSDCGELEKVF